MLQINHYKKVCQLTDSEVDKVTEFFSALCEVKHIEKISVYIEDGNIYCAIEGLDEPFSKVVGSSVKQDKEVNKI